MSRVERQQQVHNRFLREVLVCAVLLVLNDRSVPPSGLRWLSFATASMNGRSEEAVLQHRRLASDR